MHNAIRRADPCGDYELLQRVGSGSYGEVFKARDVRSGEFAAVKIVKLETGDNFADIQQEILVLKDCVHRNIISYSGSYLRRDRLWIVMEYCSGGSLQDIYEMIGPLSELQIAFICRETLHGLKYLHQRGKIHRDVKGANILLAHNGDVKLADFGIAAQITATLGKRKSFIGSPYWMAPEVANVERTGGYGSECDVWAVGITAIELAELKPPYYYLSPIQVLSQMTKSSYKIPKLKDKKKWSLAFASFIKSCLAKNPKKRPSPDKLLANDPFVSGALSARLTRELLDRVNHPERFYQTKANGGVGEERLHIEMAVQADPSYATICDQHFELECENYEVPSRRVHSQHQQMIGITPAPTTPPSSSSASSSQERLNFGVDDEDQSYHSERTLLASQGEEQNGESTLLEESLEKNQSVEKKKASGGDARVMKRPRDLRGLLPRGQRPISSASEQPTTAQLKPSRLLARIDESFRSRWIKLRSKSTSMVNMQMSMFSPTNVPLYTRGCHWPSRHHNHQPFQSRPMTCCFGMVPTPQVTMGACFVSVLHRTSIRVNCCAQWFHPANRKQFMIIGAEQGIFAMDLSHFTSEEEALVQLHERRCTWLYVVNDTLTALQGKTPYLYRHEMLQLFQHELITQKLAKSIDKLSQKLKPKSLLSTLRMPETRDCYQCTVERSINNENLYLCCAVPHAVLLFQWYEPLSRFVHLKRLQLDKLNTPYTDLQHAHKPFNLVFRSGTANSDLPMVCIGISRVLTSPVGTAQELLRELRSKPQKDKFELQLVDFNGSDSATNNLNDLYSAGLFGDCSSDDEMGTWQRGGPMASPRSTSSLRTIWRWREKLENVVTLRQLDKETLFIAHNNQILITDFNGTEKNTDLMQTSFTFDFNLDYAIPLSDSVLAFHKHGVVGKSFFNGAVTQDLNDPSKLYKLVGRDSLVVLKVAKCRSASTPSEGNASDLEGEEPSSADGEEHICVLTGHVSTMTPP
uniref:Mitogen-activated protein kinase kinase kinase kinase n=1 Tax=Globodera rostochiensis TaxID=31243 RepID=A0A914HHV7_GLORO